MGFLLVPSVCPNKPIWSRPITVTWSRAVPLLCRTTAYWLNFVSMVSAIWSVRHEGRVLLCIYYSFLRDYIAFSFHSHKKSTDRRGSSGTHSIIEYLIAMLTAQLGIIIKSCQRDRVYIHNIDLGRFSTWGAQTTASDASRPSACTRRSRGSRGLALLA